MNFYKCRNCQNIITTVNKSDKRVVCCNEKMEVLIAGSVEASKEKHIPVITIEEGNVIIEIGELIHPMSEEHYIEWIALETEKGIMIEKLNPKEEPKVYFKTNQKIKAAYAYCNLHGLWKKEVI